MDSTTRQQARPRGRLITLEGVEGSGKSTVAADLLVALRERGLEFLATREPGGTEVGTVLRRLLLDPRTAMTPQAELLLYCADRVEHVENVIRPALDAGIHVLCDRFSDATRAYQGIARGLGLDLVDRVNIGDIEPHLTLLLDLPAERGLRRARARNSATSFDHEGRFEDEELAFHEAVRSGYLQLARAYPERIRRVDADQTPDAVLRDVVRIVVDQIAFHGSAES